MTTDVITAPADTSIGELADMLSTNRISAMPIVGDHDRLVGVVSLADLLATVAAGGQTGARASRRRGTIRSRAPSARDVMSTPVMTIAPDAPLPEAAKEMRARKVKRLPVTDDAGQLLGIVSRADLLHPYTRPDTAIQQEIIDHVLRRALWIDPNEIKVHLDAGVVTLTGAVGRRSTAAIATRLTAQVPGVVAVVDKVRFTYDDTALAASRIHRTHPFSAEPFNP